MPLCLWRSLAGGVGVAESACPSVSACLEALECPAAVFEAVVGAAQRCEVPGDCRPAFGPGGSVIEVAVCCWGAASGEDTCLILRLDRPALGRCRATSGGSGVERFIRCGVCDRVAPLRVWLLVGNVACNVCNDWPKPVEEIEKHICTQLVHGAGLTATTW